MFANSLAYFRISLINSVVFSPTYTFSFSTFVFNTFAAKNAIVCSVLLFLPFVAPSCSSRIDERLCNDSRKRAEQCAVVDGSFVKESKYWFASSRACASHVEEK